MACGELGHDVYFIEPVAADKLQPRGTSLSCSANAAYFRAVMRQFDLESHAALLLAGTKQTVGLPYDSLRSVAAESDCLINISGMLADPALTEPIPVRVYLDLDPGFNQLWHAAEGLDVGFDGHTHFVTIGPALGEADCVIPTCGRTWIATRQPVVLSEWPPAERLTHDAFTTVANWRGYGSITYKSVFYGQKAHAWRELMALPDKTHEQFVVALAIHPDEQRDLAQPGRARLDAGRSGAGDGYARPLSGLRARLERRDRRGQERLRGGALRLVQRSQRLLSRLRSPRRGAGDRLQPVPPDRRGPVRVRDRQTTRARGSTPSSATTSAIRVPLARSPRSTSTHRACCRSCSSAWEWTDEHRHAGCRASGRRGRASPASARRTARRPGRVVQSSGGRPRIVDLDTRPLPYASSFAIEEVTVRFDDGSSLELVCKDTGEAAMLPEARRIKPRFLHDPLREIATYERILAPFDVGAPRFYGSADRPSDAGATGSSSSGSTACR